MKKFLQNRYFKSGTLYLFGNLFNKAIAFITVPIFTRILSTSEYGIVSTYSSWVSIASVIIGLSLGKSIRNAFVDFKDDLNAYISSVFALSFINFILITIIAFAIDVKLRFSNPLLIGMCLAQAFGSYIIQSLVIKYMMEEESVKRTVLLVVPNLSAAILSILMILNMDSNLEYGRILPMFLITSAFGICIFLVYLVKGKKIFDKVYWTYALRISIPLIFQGLSINILSTADRTMITAFRDVSETGIYSVVYNFSLVATVVTSSLESVWIPYFTKKLVNNLKNNINIVASVYIELCTIIFCGLLIIAPEVLIIFASKKYSNGINLIAPIVLASFFQYLYTFAVNTEYFYKKTTVIAINTFIAAGINLILNLILIPQWGALAAAYTTVVAYICSFLIHYAYCKKLDKELFPIKMFIFPVVVIICMTLLQYATLKNVFMRWIGGSILTLIYVAIVLIRHKEQLRILFRQEGNKS